MAQGLDRDPVQLMDELRCYRFEAFHDAGGFIQV